MASSQDSPEYLAQTKQPEIIGICSFFICLVLAAITLRFYARWHSQTRISWDDYLALAAVPFALLPSIFDLVQLRNGFGKHMETVNPPSKIENYGYLLYVLLMFYNPGLVFFKFSFLALYLRVFNNVHWLRYSCYVLFALISVWFLGTEFALIFRCHPIRAAWDPSAGTCISESTIFIAQSVPTIFFDIAIILLPVRLVWGLQMTRASKIGLVFTFALGGLVTIISIVRLVSTVTSSDADLTYGYVDLGLWSAAEPTTGLVCCCISTYRPIVTALRRRIGLTTTYDGSNSSTRPAHAVTQRTLQSYSKQDSERDGWSDTVELTHKNYSRMEETDLREGSGSTYGDEVPSQLSGKKSRSHGSIGGITVQRDFTVRGAQEGL